LMATYCAAQETKTFIGEITDEQLNCVQVPMKAPEDARNKEECVFYWTYWKGERYVLYNAATKSTYQLADQDEVLPFVGENVLIRGTENNKMINVAEIKKAETGHKSNRRS
jgi:hypothetical protein